MMRCRWNPNPPLGWEVWRVLLIARWKATPPEIRASRIPFQLGSHRGRFA